MIHITGIVIAISTFLIIGLFHPLVIKTEYYLGTRPWWLFLFGGIVCVVLSLLQADIVWSSLLGVLGASLLWSIGDIFDQEKRVVKAWLPMHRTTKEQKKKKKRHVNKQ